MQQLGYIKWEHDVTIVSVILPTISQIVVLSEEENPLNILLS